MSLNLPPDADPDTHRDAVSNKRLKMAVRNGQDEPEEWDQIAPPPASSAATRHSASHRPHTQVNVHQESSTFQNNKVQANRVNIGNQNVSSFHLGPDGLSASAERQIIEFTELQKNDLFDRIPYAQGAAFNDLGQQATSCVTGTREAVLQQIYEWAGNPNDKSTERELGFWLRGMAGTGKSTIARTVAERLSDAGFFVASFFFRRGGGDLASPEKFVTTVLRQLARYNDLRDCLLKAFECNRGEKKQLEYEWRSLIRDTLRSIDQSTAIALIIDAVDESEGSMSPSYEMFDFLSDEANFGGLNIRIVVTSRPRQEEAAIHQLFVLHDIPPEMVEADIKRFLGFEFGKLRKSITRTFPKDEHLQQLARRCTPLFISARTSLSFITELNRDLKARFDQLMDQTTGKSFEEGLDHMYLAVIKEALFRQGHTRRRNDIIRRNLEDFQRLIGPIITLREPLDSRCLALLLGIDLEYAREYLEEFRAVLDVPHKDSDAIRVFHQSFPDFLSTWSRVEATCTEHNQDHRNEQLIDPKDLWINWETSNLVLFESCLDIIEGKMREQGCHGLKEDICDVRGAGTRVRELDRNILLEKLPSALRYACNYWSTHFVVLCFQRRVCQRLFKLLERHLLHWVEAMSWLGNLDHAIRQLDRVHQHLERNQREKSGLREFVRDAARFTKLNRNGIKEAPLQIYSSALLLAPKQSIVKQNFIGDISNFSWITSHIQEDETWDASLFHFDGHKAYIVDFKFSADGQRIASIDANGKLLVWEATTACVLWTGSVKASCIDVSSDNSLACGDKMGNVTIWRKMEKANQQQLNVGANSPGRVIRVVFSDDASVLAWMSEDGDVSIWDTSSKSGMPKPQTLFRSPFSESCKRKMDLPSPTLSVGIKKGGERYIAAVERRGHCITIWRAQNGRDWTVIHTTHDWCSDSFLSGTVRLALLGTSYLISWARYDEGQGVCAWDLENQTRLQWRPPSHNGKRITHVPGTSFVIAPAEEYSLGCYDFGTYEQQVSIDGEMKPLRTFERSQNAEPLSVSADGTTLVARLTHLGQIAMWDVSSGQRVAILRRQNLVGACHVSPTERRLLAVQFDEKVHMFECIQLLQMEPYGDASHAGNVMDMKYTGVVLSPDGKLVAASHFTASSSIDVWSIEGSSSCKVAVLLYYWGPKFASWRRHHGLVFSPSGKWVVAFVEVCRANQKVDFELHCWNLPLHHKRRTGPDCVKVVETDEKRGSFNRPPIKSAFSENSRFFSFLCADACHLVDLESGQQLRHPSLLLDKSCIGITCMTDNTFLVADKVENDKIRLFRYSFDEPRTQLGPDIPNTMRSILGLAYSASRRIIVILFEGVGIREITVKLLKISNAVVSDHVLNLPLSVSTADGHLMPSFCNDGCCLRLGQFGSFPLNPPSPGQNMHTHTGVSISSLPRFPWLFSGGRRFWWLPEHWRAKVIGVAGTTVLFQRPDVPGPEWLHFHGQNQFVKLQNQLADNRAVFRRR